MSIQTIIFLLLILVVLVFIAINIVLLRKFNKTNEKIDALLEKGKIKEFKDIFLSQKEKNENLEEQVKDAFLKIKKLEDICEITIRKIGIVRFNPFSDMGGNQSFIIAMLDNKNNGFLISSLFVNDGNRVYTKAVKNGKSEHALSPQEVEAIDKAINFK